MEANVVAPDNPNDMGKVEIEVKRRIFDPEEHKVTLEIFIGEPFNVTVQKSGSIGRIAFQLAEQFSLPIQHKDLVKILQESAKKAKLETEKEAQLYLEFLSWFAENYADLAKNAKCFVVPGKTKDEPPRARLVESALSRFFQTYVIPLHSRNNILSYWRKKGWLKTNSCEPNRFKKVVRFKAQDGTTRLLRVYEIELHYEEKALNSEEMQEIALLT
jgi:hypothetical protein